MKQGLQQATGKFINGWHKIKNFKGYANFINIDGELMSDQWFDNCWIFKDGFAKVHVDNKGWNFINTNGDLIFESWFDDIIEMDKALERYKKPTLPIDKDDDYERYEWKL